MSHNNSRNNTIPQKIINNYYQKFYQERKTFVLASPMTKFSSFTQHKSKQNVVFQIDYETNKLSNSESKSNNSKILNKSTSKSSVQNQTQSLISNPEFPSQQLNLNLLADLNSLNIPKKNITFQVSNKKSVKGSIKHIKSQARKKQFKVPNFQHFPQGNNITKNKTKSKNSVDHFLKVHPYSKTLDFVENMMNPEKQLQYFHSTVQVSPQKDEKFFTLQNFSHIQVHKNKKNSYPLKTKEVFDIVKRKQVSDSPTQNFMQSSIVLDSDKRKEKPKINEDSAEKVSMKQRAITPSTKNYKEGLFKQFKPKIELKRRPSTGIPLRKNRNSVVQSALDQHKNTMNSTIYSNPNQKSHNFFNTIDAFDMPNYNNSRHIHSGKHSRGMTLNLNSPRGLKIHSKQVHLLKYVDLSEADKIKDYFQNSRDLGQKDLKNLVHLEFHRSAGKVQIYSGNKKNNKKKEQFFQPWESIDRDQQIIQSDQLIKKQIEQEIFNTKYNN